MAFPNTQPTLPAEGAYSDAELLFISEEPRNLFPPNQNSNWGLLRRVLTDKSQEVNDLLTDLYNQMFYSTATGATGYLGRWEDEVGVPKAPTGYTDMQRRVWVGLNKKRGLFTESLVNSVIESMLGVAASGPPIELGVGGAALSAGGSPLYGEGGTVQQQYRVYYNPRTYSYEVWIVSSSTPDLVSLTRKLTRITPAGMSYTIDNTKSGTGIIDYGRTVLNKQPNMFYRMNDFSDYSGYANNGTGLGGVTGLTNPGLLTAGKNDDQGGKTFDGFSGYMTVNDAPQMKLNDNFTIEFWVKQQATTGLQTIMDKAAYLMRINAGLLEFQGVPSPTLSLTAGTTYHVVFRKAGSKIKWTINDVDRTGVGTTATVIGDFNNQLVIGRRQASSTEFFFGALDELAVYNRWISDAEIHENYNAGKAIL